MRAIGYQQSRSADDPLALVDIELPDPTPGAWDLLVRVVVEVPTKLSSQERELLRRFAESRGEQVSDDGIVSKIKSAFS